MCYFINIFKNLSFWFDAKEFMRHTSFARCRYELKSASMSLIQSIE